MSKSYIINLSDIELNDFLNEGFIVQKPGTEQIWLGIGESCLSGESEERPYFFRENFYCNGFEAFYPQVMVKTNTTDFKNWITTHLTEKLEIFPTECFDEEFLTDVKKMIGWIKNKPELKKLVAVTRAVYKIENDSHPISQFPKLNELNGSLYGMWKGSNGFIGVSPEPLFVRDFNHWKTRALAGTISTGVADYKNKLLCDPKEKEEHDLVVKDISQKLKTKTKDIEIGKKSCVKFGDIAHIQTEIRFSGFPVEPNKLIKTLSPTAALGGYPEDMVFKHLKELNYYQHDGDNRLFGGIFGFEFEHECFGLVGIRNIYWNGKKANIDSGCGVVADSSALKEATEVKIKRDTIERIFYEPLK